MTGERINELDSIRLVPAAVQNIKQGAVLESARGRRERCRLQPRPE